MRIFLILLILGFLTGLGEANIRENPETDESSPSILVAEQYCQDTPSLSNDFQNLDVARRGCCSHHKGVCGCKGNRQECCDGTLSPSCTCVSPTPSRTDFHLEE